MKSSLRRGYSLLKYELGVEYLISNEMTDDDEAFIIMDNRTRFVYRFMFNCLTKYRMSYDELYSFLSRPDVSKDLHTTFSKWDSYVEELTLDFNFYNTNTVGWLIQKSPIRDDEDSNFSIDKVTEWIYQCSGYGFEQYIDELRSGAEVFLGDHYN